MARRTYNVQPAITAPLYFANPTGAKGSLGAAMRQRAMNDHVIGYIDTPRQGNRRPAGVVWCADNGCFSEKFDERQWWNFLQANAYAAADCVFAVAPDVVGDAAATLERSRPWLSRIRDLGYRVAFVAQDGFDAAVVPWADFDVLFIGGSDDFKLGEAGAAAIAEARARGKWVHVGRVNSRIRYRYVAGLGADSCDGTYLTFGNTNAGENLVKLLAWVTDLRDELEAAALPVPPAATEREQIAAAAAAAGWVRVDALHADGYERFGETLAIIPTEAGRALHAVYALYVPAGADEPIVREAVAVDVLTYVLERLSAGTISDFDVLAAA